MPIDPISAGVTAGGGLLGSLFGELFSAGDRWQARQAIERAMRGLQEVDDPVLRQMQAEQLGPSAYEDIRVDPALEGAQYGALGELDRIAQGGGLTLEDKVNLNQIEREQAQQNQARRQGILNLLARQGVNTGGASVAMQLGGAREQAERAALAGANTAADARRRATEAVLKRGQLAGQQRGQSFQEQDRRAAARDAIARYNASAREGAQRYNLGIPQQQFNNQMQRAQAIANASNGQAGFYQSQADRTRGMASDIGTGLGMATGAFLGGGKQQAPATSYDMGYSQAPELMDEKY